MAKEELDICSVCLDHIKDAITILECKHNFHPGCIREWVNMKPECPLCRKITEANERHYPINTNIFKQKDKLENQIVGLTLDLNQIRQRCFRLNNAYKYAMEALDLDTIKSLVIQGVDVNYNSLVPIRSAIVNNRLDVIQFYIDHGISIHYNDLEDAIKHANIKTLDFLLDQKIQYDDENDLTRAFDHIVENYEIIELIISKGNIVFKNCALIVAVEKNKLEIVKLLVENGADAKTQDNAALICAVINGNLKIVKYLVSNGGNPHSDKYRILQNAISFNHWEIVKFLVQSGAKTNNLGEYNKKLKEMRKIHNF